MAALERAGERLEADVVRPAVAGEHDHRHLLTGRKGVSPSKRSLRALDAARDRSRVLERDMEPGDVPGGRGEAGRRDLQAAGRIHDDDGLADRAQDRANHHRDPTALAQRVPSAQRLHPVLVAHDRLQTGHRLTSQANIGSGRTG